MPTSKQLHRCDIPPRLLQKFPPVYSNVQVWKRFKTFLISFILIYEGNPQCTRYFRSEKRIEEEKQRQYNSQNWYTIHPFSRFRAWYEAYLIFMYLALIWIKYFDFGFFMKGEMFDRDEHSGMLLLSNILDLLAYIDIIMNFYVGFFSKKTGQIELRKTQIGLKYLLGPYFVCDVLSSLPKNILCKQMACSDQFYGLITLLNLFKLARIVSVYQLIFRFANYMGVTSHYAIFLLTFFTMIYMQTHFVACIHSALPQIEKWMLHNKHYNPKSVMITFSVYKHPFWTRYVMCFFKSCANALNVELNIFIQRVWYEQYLTTWNYIIGKLIIIVTWMILLDAITVKNHLFLKYSEQVNQVEKWMEYKRLPDNLRTKIREYFKYKYPRHTYFDEKYIKEILNSSMMMEITKHSCKKLVENSMLFCHLDDVVIREILKKFTSELYLANEPIVQSGSMADCIFFIGSGTVAVYTHSGREICHLTDYSYFGEMCVLFKEKRRYASVIAIETTEIYKLERRYFEKYFLNNKLVYNDVMKQAEFLLQRTEELEKQYKEMLFKQQQQQGG